jgi:hypothetical protein
MFPNFKNSRLVAEVLCQLQLALLLRGAAVSGSDEYHRPDHVGGHIETGHPAAAVAIKVHQELAFAEVGCETIGEGWLDFLIFSHPLPPHELAVLHDKCPGGAQFIIGVRARVIREVRSFRERTVLDGAKNILVFVFSLIMNPRGPTHLAGRQHALADAFVARLVKYDLIRQGGFECKDFDEAGLPVEVGV